MYIAKNKDGVVNLFYKKPKQRDAISSPQHAQADGNKE